YADLTGDDKPFDAHDAMGDVMATIDVTERLAEINGVSVLNEAEEVAHAPAAAEDLVDISRPEGFCDFAGKLKYDKDGLIVFNFGKNMGQPVVGDPSYARWMLGTDFPEQTKEIIRKELGG
ncbi:MAG: hypothetical protein DRJ15_15565, partial [Bacteroidetes bacterium]